MSGVEISKYINKKCNDCCQLKRKHMELYKLNLPNVLVNAIDYSYDKEDECDECQLWRHYSKT